MDTQKREPAAPNNDGGDPGGLKPTRVLVESDNSKDALSLLERLDPAIGEATSVVGAMLTELLRRTLRGGVMRIGDEMHGYVSQKVDNVLAERTPGLEQLAADVAEHTARTAATEVATEEVHALAQRTQESDRELAAQIETAARTAQQQTTEAADALATQVRESERRTQEQVQDFVERAKEGRARFKAKLAELENGTAAVRQDLGRQLKDSHAGLRAELAALTKANDALAARVAELEKPRGLRALFAWLFGRRKPKAETIS
jgi:chromosome segregation ATPase